MADEDQSDLPGLADLGAYIRAQRETARLSMRKLASMAGVSNPYLSQIERGLRNPSAEILQAIARALEISSETLYVRAGILDHDHEDRPELETAINRAPDLTEPQRQALMEMYRSFRRLTAMDKAPQPDSESAGPGRRSLSGLRDLIETVATAGVVEHDNGVASPDTTPTGQAEPDASTRDSSSE